MFEREGRRRKWKENGGRDAMVLRAKLDTEDQGTRAEYL